MSVGKRALRKHLLPLLLPPYADSGVSRWEQAGALSEGVGFWRLLAWLRAPVLCSKCSEARTDHAAQAVGEDGSVRGFWCSKEVSAGAYAGPGLGWPYRFVDVDGIVASDRHALSCGNPRIRCRSTAHVANCRYPNTRSSGDAVMPTGGAFTVAAIDAVAVLRSTLGFRRSIAHRLPCL